MPEPRYFSMPSIDVGAEVFRNRALNCWPWVRSLTHSPDAVIHSPAEIVAAWPTMVTRSRCPRAFARRTQKPFSALRKVTRSTRPARTSWVDDSGCRFMRTARSSDLLPRAGPVVSGNRPVKCYGAQRGHGKGGLNHQSQELCYCGTNGPGTKQLESPLSYDARSQKRKGTTP